ncbi:hypothetical protein EJB05_02526 [Eragrostis curvula]|uniref:Uncharacterized protein n=1 Tax=Eragrostis curvula TaxID=38414 RepID=A0A5J9WSA8_9POAL|nr:hypothetical protein EJB05_02526 [Eragrostis curvula]
MAAAASPDDGHRDHSAAANMSSDPTPTTAASGATPTTAASVTIPTAAAGVSRQDLISELQRGDRSDLWTLIVATDRPILDVVADFVARFPLERRHTIVAFLCTILEFGRGTISGGKPLGPRGLPRAAELTVSPFLEKILDLAARLNAFAILHQSFVLEPEHPYISVLLNAACRVESHRAECGFIQLLLTSDFEDYKEVLKLSAVDYSNGSSLQSLIALELLPREKIEMSKDKALSRLKHLCRILGLDCNKMLKEFGCKDATKRRVLTLIGLLEGSVTINFNKLKKSAEDLLYEWKLANTPFQKMAKFYWMVVIHDSNSSDEIFGDDFLSNAAVDKAEKEANILKDARIRRQKNKYLAKEKKLIKLLEETHLNGIAFGFNSTEEVEGGDYREAKRKLKKIIEKVKSLSKERKEMVMRVEILKRAVSLKYTPEQICMRKQKMLLTD